MSLFVGNVSRFVEQKDIEKEFKSYGECAVDFRNSKKGKFAFIQFKNDADAEQAKKNLQGKDLQGSTQQEKGLKLNIEWSKKSGRFDENRGGSSNPAKDNKNRSRSKSHRKSRKAHKSRSRSQSKSHQRNRSAPRYISKSPSAESLNDCPRDRILKEKIKEMKRVKRDKKASEKAGKESKMQEEHPNLITIPQVSQEPLQVEQNGNETIQHTQEVQQVIQE